MGMVGIKRAYLKIPCIGEHIYAALLETVQQRTYMTVS